MMKKEAGLPDLGRGKRKAAAPTQRKRAQQCCAPTSGRTSTAIHAAFMSPWGELLQGLIRAGPHTLAGIALCSRLVVN